MTGLSQCHQEKNVLKPLTALGFFMKDMGGELDEIQSVDPCQALEFIGFSRNF